MSRICLECVLNLFKDRDYLYFITIKPPPTELNHMAIYSILEYLRKKHLVFWLVKCQSTNGFEHYHGIVSFNESQTPHKGCISLLQRQINRKMGFVQITPLQSSITAIYRYIRDVRNTNDKSYDQIDNWSHYELPHRCHV